MIFFENSYSLDTRSQLEDRIHRRGQTGQSVLYIDFCGSDLDERIIKALQQKTRMYEAIFSRVPETAPVMIEFRIGIKKHGPRQLRLN